MADLKDRPEEQTSSTPSGHPPDAIGEFPLTGGLFGPLANAVARINVGVHTKLLSGFLIGALLLVAMGALSLVVISRMSERVDALNRAQEKVDLSRQMEYAVTAQSHFRAMALLTNDDSNNAKIANAKEGFVVNLQAVDEISPPEEDDFFTEVRETNTRFGASSEDVLALYTDGDIDEALKLHMGQEHVISHELEAAMRELNGKATDEALAATAAFQSDRATLTATVWVFSGVSLVFALLVGLVMSLTFVRPIRRIDSVVAAVAGGDFDNRVEVPNRDEFGTLSTHINRMAQRLGNLYHDIQDELKQRKRTEEESKRRTTELVAANSELESMTYSISHNLWAPLQRIESSTKALLEQEGGKLDAQAKAQVESVLDERRRIGEHLDDIVNMSRVLAVVDDTRGEVRKEDVDLSEVARACAAGLTERDPERSVEFVIAEGLVAEGDRGQLQVVLENLIGNAWKFTGKHSEARIEFGKTTEDGKTVFFVRDDGAGFDMAEADELFGAFKRLHSEDEFDGVGVGLATIQRIIQGHGGRVWAEGEVEKGATFRFTLS